MFTSLKTFAIAGTLLMGTQAIFADGLFSMGFGSQIRLPQASPAPTVAPASPYAGSPRIYYSNVPYTPPSITPPSMNILPSYGYSTGLYFQPTNFRAPTFVGSARGNYVYAPPIYTPNYYTPTFGAPTTIIVNQNYYNPPAYNYTTVIPPQPRLSRGVLRP